MCLAGQTLYILAGNGDSQPLKMLSFAPPTAPAIVQQPANQTIFLGQSATFSVGASGGGPYTYQWRKGGANLPGANHGRLTVPNASFTDAADFDVQVSNPVGACTSQVASLTVLPLPEFANLTNGLVLHLKFDGDFTDSSGRANDGSPSGTPAFVPGKLGQAVELQTDTGSGVFNFVTTTSDSSKRTASRSRSG